MVTNCQASSLLLRPGKPKGQETCSRHPEGRLIYLDSLVGWLTGTRPEAGRMGSRKEAAEEEKFLDPKGPGSPRNAKFQRCSRKPALKPQQGLVLVCYAFIETSAMTTHVQPLSQRNFTTA